MGHSLCWKDEDKDDTEDLRWCLTTSPRYTTHTGSPCPHFSKTAATVQGELASLNDAVPQALAVPLSATRVAAATEPVGPALATVLERSRMLCMLRYEKELLREGSFLEASRKAGVAFSDEQLAVFRGMWVWVSRARARRVVQSASFGCKCLSWAATA